jgi:hypothetical protein
MAGAAPSPVGPQLLGDLLIGQTDGQIRAFDAFTAAPTPSILPGGPATRPPMEITPEMLGPSGS